MTRQWLNIAEATGRPEALLSFYGYNVSLSWTALVLLNPAASHGKLNVLDWSPDDVALVVNATCLVWGLLVVAYFASTWRREIGAPRRPLALLLDLSIVLLCPLPASPVLQPAPSPVTLLVPAVCLAWAALDESFSARVRIMAASTIGLGFCLTHLGPRQPLAEWGSC